MGGGPSRSETGVDFWPVTSFQGDGRRGVFLISEVDTDKA